jgi:hypothetical protein
VGAGVGELSGLRWGIPWALIGLRAVACPLLAVGAWRGWAGEWLGAIVVVALLSDIYDGVSATRWGCL